MDTQVFTPSTQQQAFFDFVEFSSGSCVLEAVAGAGKTTTLVQAIKRMRGNVAVVMFNRDAATDFKAKAKKAGVERQGLFISTCHGAGYSAWRRFDPKADVQERKTNMIIEAMVAELKPLTSEQIALLDSQAAYLCRIISLAKNYLFGVKVKVSNAAWAGLADHFGLNSELPEDADPTPLYELATMIFNMSAAGCTTKGDRPGVIDYDDMIWAPLAYNVRFFTNNHVLLDEAQDTNPARRELVKRMLNPVNGRLYAVGDSCQAIYGFTGANSDSLDLIAKDFKCTRLPLTVTYRCPKSVVSHVQQWVSHIEAHETAPEGIVRPVKLDPPQKAEGDAKPRPWFMSDPPRASDAILCRYNKPLVKTAFSLLAGGIPCKMQGRDIGQGLIKLATKWKVKSLDALQTKLEAYRQKEIAKAKAKQSESAEQAVNDRVDCTLVFIERCRAKGNHEVSCVVAEITSLFSDDTAGYLTLSSGHKAKGREWGTVYWIQHTERARELKDWEQAQERNLKYVIGTRAMNELVLLNEETK